MQNVSDCPLVEVTWTDAYINTSEEVLVGTEEEFTFGQVIERCDIGYLVSLDRHKLVLAVGIGKTDNSFNHSNSIPRRMVSRIEYLERSGKCLGLKETKKRTRTTVPTGSSNTSASD